MFGRLRQIPTLTTILALSTLGGCTTASSTAPATGTSASGATASSADLKLFSADTTLTATLTAPADGVMDFDVTSPLTWTAVDGADAYYLWVGTSPGAKDLVDSGEIQATSYFSAALPAQQLLYARISTKRGDTWTWSDSVFGVTAASLATLVYPPDGTIGADLTSRGFQWSNIPDAQTYYLYVGTSLGAKDLVDSGELQQTQLAVVGLPQDQPLFARIYTEVAGQWFYSDSTFSTHSPQATFVYPLDGDADVDVSKLFQWTSVPGAGAYYLKIGTSDGANDVVDTGELQDTSYFVGNVPAGVTLYARLYTELNGVWLSSSIRFVADALSTSALTQPLAGASAVDPTQPFAWSAVQGAESYYLYVGTTPGAKDLVDSGELTDTSYSVSGRLPPNRTLYARVYTKRSGQWFPSTDVSFTAAPQAATFTYPLDGAVDVDITQPFSWTSMAGADGYYLYVGTQVGAKDLVDSGLIQQSDYVLPTLPTNQPLYGRIYTYSAGQWLWRDIRFTAAATAQATLMMPADGATNVGLFSPLFWSKVADADAYYVYIGSQPGAKDVYDSGAMTSDHWYLWYVPNLAPQTQYFVQMWTQHGNAWFYQRSSFTTGDDVASRASDMDRVLTAVDQVRSDADENNVPRAGSQLEWIARQNGHTTAYCSDYAMQLLVNLAAADVAQARQVGVCLNPNSYDCHTLVEVFVPSQGEWVLVDPTFDLTVRRADDGGFATANDMSGATRSMSWDRVTYQFLGASGSRYAQLYYLDYPLLFLNVISENSIKPMAIGSRTSELPYLSAVEAPLADQSGSYAVAAPDATTVSLQIDGADNVLATGGVDNITQVFPASNVSSLPSSAQLYRINRYVF